MILGGVKIAYPDKCPVNSENLVPLTLTKMSASYDIPDFYRNRGPIRPGMDSFIFAKSEDIPIRGLATDSGVVAALHGILKSELVADFKIRDLH